MILHRWRVSAPNVTVNFWDKDALFVCQSNDLSGLWQHVFVAQTGLTWRLAVDLLDKVNNPDTHQPYSEVDDDDLEVTPALKSHSGPQKRK